MILDAAPAGMLLVDDQGLIVLANRHVERLFGYEREELLGRPIEVLLPSRFRAGHTGLRAAFAGDPRTGRWAPAAI